MNDRLDLSHGLSSKSISARRVTERNHIMRSWTAPIFICTRSMRPHALTRKVRQVLTINKIPSGTVNYVRISNTIQDFLVSGSVIHLSLIVGSPLGHSDVFLSSENLTSGLGAHRR
jgi:hypothetical protein